MTSFAAQMRLHEASRVSTSSLEASARAAIRGAFDEWDAGVLDASSVRVRLEAIVRRAYRSSASVARQVAVESSGLSDWSPKETNTTAYLSSLVNDIRTNLRKVKNGVLTREQAISRMGHTAGVAAQRGYTDQIIFAYTDLEKAGFELRKFWVANFVNNTPCPACTRLHGTEVGLHEMFMAETDEPGVYRDLIGPPRHPRCKCRLFIFVVTLENAFEEPDFEAPQDSLPMMSTDDVKNMPASIFAAVKASFSSIVAFFKKRKKK